MKKEKQYIPKARYECDNGSYMEFGLIKNPTYDNRIYKKVRSEHEGEWSEHYDEMRIDEALNTIQGLAEALK